MDGENIMSHQLPAQLNQFVTEDQTPSLEYLVEKRRLGRTNLCISTPIESMNAYKYYCIGFLDYVHLRVKLPTSLVGSGVFLSSPTNHAPESYFLMRRCVDGFVSATGLFKAAFPRASKDEEIREKDYLRKLPETDIEEIAGNIWVPPLIALELGDTYGLSWKWVTALLDNKPVPHPSSANPELIIAQPPYFEMPPKSTTSSSQTKGSAPARKRTVSRDIGSTSPVKDDAPTPAKKPRKPRAKKEKAKKEKEVARDTSTSTSSSSRSEEAEAVVEAITADEAAALIATAEAEAEAEPLPEDTVRMSITSDKLPGEGDTEITRTTLKLELPANSPDLELPKDTEGVVEAAREMIESAKELQEGTIDTSSSASPPTKRGSKRKAETLEDAEANCPEEIVQEVAEGDVADLATGDGEIEMRPSKRTRVMVAAEEYRREKVMRRALVGLSSALAVGVMVPYLSNFF